MYKKASSGNPTGRSKYNKYARGSRRGYSNNNRSRSGGGRSGGRGYSQHIAHSMYISKAVEQKQEPKYIPENTFDDFKLDSQLARNISDRGYINPTKIQDQAIPSILKGRDVIGIGSTGSGKTAAFLIPMIDKTLKDPRNRVLIISPTRELASQIEGEFRRLTKDMRIRMVLVMGGASIRTQMQLLRQKPAFVVATPGRLIDLEKRRVLNLANFNNIVLDEVDRMLDMGFVNDITDIISKLGEYKQSLFFSATMSSKVEVVANKLLKDPVKVQADKQEPHRNVHQDIVKVPTKNHKMQVLQDLLRGPDYNKVLVFSRTKRGADEISQGLQQKGFKVDSLHGNKSQHIRSKVLAKFKQDKIDILVATDVASRGIDVPDITHVINFDEPATYDDYIHRIGRTGRIGKSGIALTFVIGK